MGNLILIRETNVDGCGGYAEILVRFSQSPTLEKLNLLRKRMRELRSSMDCPDTETVVHEALHSMFGNSAQIVEFQTLEY